MVIPNMEKCIEENNRSALENMKANNVEILMEREKVVNTNNE